MADADARTAPAGDAADPAVKGAAALPASHGAAAAATAAAASIAPGSAAAPTASGAVRSRPAREGRTWGALAAATALLLAVALVGSGLAVDATPAATRLLAQATQDPGASPYGADQLAGLAEAARAYTVGPRDGSSREALAEAVLEAAEAASAPGSPTAGRWDEGAHAAVESARFDGAPATEAMARLALYGSPYALDGAALSHLDDCNRLVSTAAPWLLACALGAAGGIALLAARGQRRWLGRALVAAPALVLAAFALLGLWGALDFSGLFAAFHGALFPQGNWTFPAQSLLISLYPLDFWMGMAALWLATTAAVAILSLAAGIALLRASRTTPRP